METLLALFVVLPLTIGFCLFIRIMTARERERLYRKLTEKASAPLPTCQHDLLKPKSTIAVDPADSFHAWCTVCKHDFRTRAPLKDSGARCGNWPCQLSVGHIGPCVSSPENGLSNVAISNKEEQS